MTIKGEVASKMFLPARIKLGWARSLVLLYFFSAIEPAVISANNFSPVFRQSKDHSLSPSSASTRFSRPDSLSPSSLSLPCQRHQLQPWNIFDPWFSHSEIRNAGRSLTGTLIHDRCRFDKTRSKKSHSFFLFLKNQCRDIVPFLTQCLDVIECLLQ